jgi:hypothetical protein
MGPNAEEWRRYWLAGRFRKFLPHCGKGLRPDISRIVQTKNGFISFFFLFQLSFKHRKPVYFVVLRQPDSGISVVYVFNGSGFRNFRVDVKIISTFFPFSKRIDACLAPVTAASFGT